MSEQAQIAARKVWRNPKGKQVFWGSFVLVTLSAALILIDSTRWDWLCITFSDTSDATTPARKISIIDVVIYAVWTLLPPAWFFYEYNWQFPDAAKLDPNLMQDMQYTQGVAQRFWAGILILFGVLLLLKHNIKLG